VKLVEAIVTIELDITTKPASEKILSSKTEFFNCTVLFTVDRKTMLDLSDYLDKSALKPDSNSETALRMLESKDK